jgi:predicted flap endonuclease-1-like 5' DNA nuclease
MTRNKYFPTVMFLDMSRIVEVEGIGKVYAEKLMEMGVKTTTDLLEHCGTARGREEMAEKTGISEKLLLEWVNLADLFRIKGVGEQFSDLLEEAGVDTVVELARRNPDNLHAKMLEDNEKKNLVNRPPSLDSVKNWVEQAKELPRMVEY